VREELKSAERAAKAIQNKLDRLGEPPQLYAGLSSDMDGRLADHKAGHCPHTASRRPWCFHVAIEFPDNDRAVRVERYLKSGSGRAFAKRHFEP
jgi:predicted GIY-YIG superfamily endonuclease